MGKPASRGGNDFTVIGYLFRQKGFFQVFGLYFFEKIGGALPHLKVRRIFSYMGNYLCATPCRIFHLHGYAVLLRACCLRCIADCPLGTIMPIFLSGQSCFNLVVTGARSLSPDRIRAVSNLSATASPSRVMAMFISVFFSSCAK